MLKTLLLAAIPVVYLLTMLLGTRLLARRAAPTAAPADPMAAMARGFHGHGRLLRPRKVLRLMKMALKLPEEQAAVTVLRAEHQALTAALLTLKRDMRRPPMLPLTPEGEIRMLALSRETLRQGPITPELLSTMLQSFHQHGETTLDERLALPLCLRVLLADRLTHALDRMLACAAQTRRGRALAGRFARSPKAIERLDRHPLSLTTLAALLTELRGREASEALKALENWLDKGGGSAAGIARQEAQEQSRLAGSLTRIAAAFQAMSELDWPRAEEAEDALHIALLEDPSGVYPRMDRDSRMMYRRRVARLARLFRAPEEAAARAALDLCDEAQDGALERHVGWYLLERDGMRALGRKLDARTLWWPRLGWLYRAGLWALALVFAVLILGRGYTLWLLPFLLPVTGCVSRAALGGWMRSLGRPLPRLELRRLEDDMRTLVVLPAQPRDSHEAIQAVKQLATARRAMPEKNVDCMLLCDWEDSMTQQGGEDGGIATAVAAAIDALQSEEGDTRWLYLLRTRVWSPRRRVFTAREGRHGAIGTVCRLIATGETEEEIDHTNFDVKELHRRYAWVMALEPDVRLEPGALLELAGAMAHPLNIRTATARGYRGVSMMGVCLAADPDDGGTRLKRLEERRARLPLRQLLTGRSRFDGVGLIRPDALLEGVDGWILPESLTHAAFLAGELAGSAAASSAAFRPAPETVNERFLREQEQARQVWELLPWLLPFVKTPEGVKRNPFDLESRFALRERFRQALMPALTVIALASCAFMRDPWLFFLMLLAPSCADLTTGRGWQRLWARIVLLPMRAYLSLDAAARALLGLLWPRRPVRTLRPDSLFVIELCAQSTLCAGFAAISAAWLPFFLPGLLLAGTMACFPLIHRHLDASGHSAQELPDTAVSQLGDIAENTWRFFEQTVTEESRWLPPETLQTHPDLGLAPTTTPEACGLYLLSCLAAREMGLIGTRALFTRVADAIGSLEQMPRWQGLFFARYELDSLAVAEPKLIPTGSNGLLCACLLTVAQGLRAFLPESDEDSQALPAGVDALAAAMRLRALYDPAAGLFRVHADPAQSVQTAPLLNLFASEGLLCSFVAVMRREAPFAHLRRLARTRVSAGLLRPMLSRHGSAEEMFLPFLLLPAGAGTALEKALRDAAQAQTRYALDGLFGVGQSAFHAFDEQLRYLTEPFGVPETALEAAPFQPVFAPYACALTLPFLPLVAADSLQQMRALGMFGRTGFLDAVDFTPSRVNGQADFALVRMQSAAHQGALLCAVAGALTNDALRRCFTDIPMAGACTLLIYQEQEPLILPAPARFPLDQTPPEPGLRRVADPAVSPIDAHLIGSGRASLLVGAQGSSAIRLHGREVTRFTGSPSAIEGPQLYLNRRGEVIRLLAPAPGGSMVYGEGVAKMTRPLPSLTAVITSLVDPVAAAAIQIVELTNDGAVDEEVALTACLVPAKEGRVNHPRERTLTAACGRATLCYGLHTHEALSSLETQTDGAAFIGSGSWEAPDWAGSDAPGVEGASLSPCMAFRAGLRLRPRSHATVILSAYLVSGRLTAYVPAAPGDLIRLSRLAARSLADSLPLTQGQLGRLTRLTGALMWRGQAHQGPVRPLTLSLRALQARGIDPERPLLAVALKTSDGLPLLKEAAEAASWLTLSGRGVTLCALCNGADLTALCEDQLAATILRRHPEGSAFVLEGLSEAEFTTLCAAARLTLIEGHGSAEEQLEALSVPLLGEELESALPGKLPEESEKWFDSGVSGFDQQTGDCVIHVKPWEAIPDWTLPLNGGRWLTLARAGGLAASEAEEDVIRLEQAFVLGEGGQGLFSLTPEPCGRSLPWQIRFSPGVAIWRTRTEALDATLTAASIPRRAAGLRTLRLRNLSGEEQRLTVHLAALFGMGETACLTAVTGGVTAQSPERSGSGFVTLIEGGCVTRIMTEADFHGLRGLPPLPDAPNAHNGCVALLSTEVTLPAGGSSALSWAVGYAPQLGDIELMLHRVRRSGASAVYRSVRQQWGQRVGAMVFSTPEKSLDLLINQWLPYQFLHSDAPMALAAQALLAPERVRPALLLMARDHASDELLPWLAARYVCLTGDEAALNDLVPHDPERPLEARDTLYARCLTALTGEVTGLAALCQRLFALQSFAPLADEPDQVELLALKGRLEQEAEGLLTAPLTASEAAWAVLGLGPGPKTAEAVRDALSRLYDPIHGLVARAPGEPQDTLAAVLLAVALRRLHWDEKAWELCRALNPIHHTDEQGRLAEYRGEPYAMAEKVYANPPHAGRAYGPPSAEAAAMMYLLIVEELLGLEKQADAVLLHPAAPDDWEDFSVTIRAGASIWHVQLGAWDALSIDGESAGEAVRLTDDGGVHEVRGPIRARVIRPN